MLKQQNKSTHSLSIGILVIGACILMHVCLRTAAAESICVTAADEILSVAISDSDRNRLAKRALEICLPLAEHGDPAAAYYVGALYSSNLGEIEPNRKETFRWIKYSAEHGYTLAQFYLGKLYEEGFYVEKNDALAKHWYEKAAKHGGERKR